MARAETKGKEERRARVETKGGLESTTLALSLMVMVCERDERAMGRKEKGKQGRAKWKIHKNDLGYWINPTV